MTERVSTLEVRQRLGDILNRVALRHDRVIVERKGKPLAAIVPIEMMQQMEQAARLKLLDILNRPESTLTQEAADKLADEAKHRSRKSIK